MQVVFSKMLDELEWTSLEACIVGADPGIFVRGGPGQVDKKALTRFFLVLSLFYRGQMVNLKEIYHFSRFQRGSNFSRGGPIAYSL